MSKHKIEICETLCRVMEVEAETVDDAVDEVESQYTGSEIILDANDFQGHTIKAL